MRHARIQFSAIEKVDLLKAWLATSIAFGLFFLGGIANVSFSTFLITIALAAVTAGIGFVGHEMMHKVTANHFGVQAEFRSHDNMLVLSIIIAFFGVIFAAPGAVYMFGHVTRRESGIISAAGPVANMVLCLLFLPLLLSSNSIVQIIGGTGLLVNALLAAFNLIPIMDFDGVKILNWSKPVYFTLLVIGALLVVLSYIIATQSSLF